MTETVPASVLLEGEPALHFLEWKHAGEVCALLIHGSFGNAAVWSDVGPRLATRLRVVAPDLRGHGASGWPADGDYSLDALVADTERLLTALAPRGPVVLVGHSLGNIIATVLGARLGTRLKGLVLVDHAMRIEEDHRAHLVGAGQRPAREFPTREEALSWARRLAGPAVGERIASMMAAANVVADGGRYRQAFDQRFLANLGPWDAEPAMRLVSAPVLIVRAGIDPVLRGPAAERMLAGFAQAELVTLEGAGHNLHMEKPAEFAAMVTAFLVRVL